MIIKVNKINVGSMSKIFGILQCIIGFVTGIFFTLMTLFDPGFVESNVGGAASIFGVWSVIVLPVLNGILGFISGAMIAWVYNICVKAFGVSFEMDIENTN